MASGAQTSPVLLSSGLSVGSMLLRMAAQTCAEALLRYAAAAARAKVQAAAPAAGRLSSRLQTTTNVANAMEKGAIVGKLLVGQYSLRRFDSLNELVTQNGVVTNKLGDMRGMVKSRKGFAVYKRVAQGQSLLGLSLIHI